jgi:hypothetical protein
VPLGLGYDKTVAWVLNSNDLNDKQQLQRKMQSASQALATQISGIFTGNGTMRYYRIVAGDGACDEQGTITLSGGGGDCISAGATLAVTAGQPIQLTARNLVGANA